VYEKDLSSSYDFVLHTTICMKSYGFVLCTTICKGE
jgi:hypothetical protein